MHTFVLWLQQTLLPRLGIAGVFIVAFFDSSFLSIPEVNDIFVVTSAAANPHRAWLTVLATTFGSLAGCSALWLVGKRGGEPFLIRKFGAAKVERTRRAFRRWDLLALAVPAILPPPMPFKMFVFSSGVFGVPYRRFLLTLAVARGLRYGGWGAAGAVYGTRAVVSLETMDAWVAAHLVTILPVLGLVILAILLVIRRRQRARAAESDIIGR